jgi:RNA polymerase sigma-70 factor, ECF subfamily
MGLTRDELAKSLSRVADGDPAAFIRVYKATSFKLYGIVVRILGRGDVADEVLQEVYFRVWQRAKDFDSARASPITWLATIARNRALDEGRRKQMRSLDELPNLLEWPSDEDIIGQHIESEEMRRLRGCLDRLEPAQREMLQLIYFEGLSRDNVAARMCQSVATVKAWLRRSLAELKGCLEP